MRRIFLLLLVLGFVSLVKAQLNGGSITFYNLSYVAADGVRSKDVCYNTPATLSNFVEATQGNAPYTYSWQKRVLPNGTWVNATNLAGTNVYEAFYATNFTDSTEFRRMVTDAANNVAYSNIVRLNVWDEINAGVLQPISQTITAPSTTITPITFSQRPSGGSNNYELYWESSTSQTGPWTTSLYLSGSYSPLSIPAYTPSNSLLNQTRYYRVTVQSPGLSSCSATTTPVVINVNPCSTTPLDGGTVVSIFDPYSYPQACQFMVLTTSTVNGTGGGGTYNYLWEIMRPGETVWSNAPQLLTQIRPLYNNLSTYEYFVPVNRTKYRRKVTDNCNNVAYSSELTYYLNTNYQPTSGSIDSSQTIATNTAPTLLNNMQTPRNYSGVIWQSSIDGINWQTISGANQLSYQPPTLTTTTYYRRKAFNNNCPRVDTATTFPPLKITVSSLTGGTITINSATASICSGTSPAMISNETLASNGTGVYTYIWQQGTGNTNQWTDIAGTNSVSYQPPPLTASIKYRRKVTDNLNATAYSNEISFTVNTCMVALSGGTISYNNSSTIICANSSLGSFSSTSAASGGNPNYTYLWQVKTNNNWYSLPNSNDENYQPMPITTTSIFRRKVTDAIGDIAYSNEITLTEASNNTALNPGSITSNTFVCNTSSNPLLISIVNASGSAVNYGYSYTWEQYQNGNWNAISTPSANAGSIQNATLLQPLANTTGLYRRKVTDFCGIYAYSNTATVQLQSLTAGSIFINSASVTTGQTPSLITNQIEPSTATGNTTTNLEITWLQSTNLNGAWNIISDANALNYQPSSLTQTTSYKRVAKELQCNLTAESNVITITVNNTSTTFNGGIIQTANTCVQNGNSPGLIEPLANNNLGGTAPYTFTWELNVNNTWTVIDNATSASYTPSSLFTTTSFRRKTTDALNNIAYSNIITINVQFQQLKPGIIGKSVVVCPNINDTFFYEILSACGGYGNLSYQWEMSNSIGGWTILPNSNSANYTLINITADCKIRRKVFDACGNSTYTNIVDVFIYPSIIGGSISPAEQTVCLNSNPQNLRLLQNYHYTNGNVTYQWQKATNVNGPWTNVQNATSAVYTPKVPISIMYYRLQITSSMCNYIGYSSVAIVRGNDFCRTMINATNSAPKKK